VIVGIDASNLRAGGGRTHIVELLRASGAHLQDIERIVVWGAKDTLDRLPNEHWLQRVHVPALDRGLPARLLWQTNTLPRLVGEDMVVFAPGGRIPRTRRPTVVMCRNMLPFERSERARFPIARRLRLETLRITQRRAFERASGVIFLTSYAQRTVTAQLRRPPHRNEVIAHGISDHFRAAPRPLRRIEDVSAEDPLRVLYVSYLAPYKHQESVARAVANLRQRVPARLDLVGQADTPRDAAALARVQAELDPSSTWLRHVGVVPHDELSRVYANAECFVFASSCENMPNVLLEAMAAGLPIACSNRGPMPEVLDDGGEYFDPESVDSILSAIETLARDPRRSFELATRAHHRAAEFTWERCAARTFAFLRKVGA
jgi:glycosyltransferase involved in cell wall biosynthesis